MRIDRAKYFVVTMTAAGTLGIAAVLLFLTLPSLHDALALSAGLTEAETEVQAQYANRRQLSDTIDNLKVAKLSVGELGGQFIHPGDELTIITDIENVGEMNGVQTHLSLDSGAGGIAEASEFDRGFSLTLNGPYRAVLNALVEIERHRHICVIRSVSFRGGGGGGPGQAVPVTVNLSGLFASPPKGL